MTTTDRPTDMGQNRTGISMSPIDGPAMIEGAALGTPRPDSAASGLAAVRTQYAIESGPVGKMPPPASLRGVVDTAVEMIRGNKPTVLLDKLAERLAFERTGVRLFDGLLVKLRAKGSWPGGPTLAELVEFRGDEASHFALVEAALKSLGADPTAMTPSADLVGVEGIGLLQAITDPRTTLAQALHAQAIAELADVAGWDLLSTLTLSLGQDELAARFRQAQAREELHRETVLRWLQAHADLAARGELEAGATAEAS